MSHSPGAPDSDDSSFDEQKKRLKHHATVLREYAKWTLQRKYQFTESGITHRRELLREFFALGAEVRLTKRDMVLMLMGGLARKS